MNTKFRRQLLQILAQTTTITQSAAPNVTTGPITVPGSPTPFDPYSYYISMMIGWDAKNISLIRQLANTINWSLYILSNGDIDLGKLRALNFTIDTSKYSDRILLILLKFAIQMFRVIYTNSGAPFKSTITDRDKRVQLLKNALTNLPDGSINNFLNQKIGGNPKIVLLNIISQIT